jgi:hypothetical protein
MGLIYLQFVCCLVSLVFRHFFELFEVPLSLTMKSLSATWITPASLGVCRIRCNEPNCSSYRLSESKRYPRSTPRSCSARLTIGRGIDAQLRHGFAANNLPRYP